MVWPLSHHTGKKGWIGPVHQGGVHHWQVDRASRWSAYIRAMSHSLANTRSGEGDNEQGESMESLNHEAGKAFNYGNFKRLESSYISVDILQVTLQTAHINV